MVRLPPLPGPLVRFLLKTAMRDMMPAAAGLPGIADTDLDGFLDRLFREATGLLLLGLALGAVLWVSLPILTVYVPLPSFWLPRKLRQRHTERLTSTRIYAVRQSVFLLKMYACMCWGQDPAVRARFALAPYPVDPGTFRTT